MALWEDTSAKLGKNMSTSAMKGLRRERETKEKQLLECLRVKRNKIEFILSGSVNLM